MDYMNGFILFVPMFAWGIGNIASARASKAAGAVNAGYWIQLLGLVLLVLLAASTRVEAQIPHFFQFVELIGVGCIGALGFFCFVKALKLGSPGTVIPLTQVNVVVSISLGMLFSNEVLTGLAVTHISGIILGVICLSWQSNFKIEKMKPIGFGLSTGVCWGAYYYFLGYAANGLHWLTALIIIRCTMVFCLGGIGLKARKISSAKVSLDIWGLILFAAICDLSALASFRQSVEISGIAITASLTAASPIISLVVTSLLESQRPSIREVVGAVSTSICVAGLGWTA